MWQVQLNALLLQSFLIVHDIQGGFNGSYLYNFCRAVSWAQINLLAVVTNLKWLDIGGSCWY